MREITLDEFRFYLERGIQQSTVNKALNRAGIIVEDAAKKECPVKTGQLRNSITHRVENSGFERVCYVGTNVEYAPYVEFGVGVYAKNGDGRQTPWVYWTPDGNGGSFHYVHNDGDEEERKKYGPRPYLFPALENNTDAIKQEILETVKGELFR